MTDKIEYKVKQKRNLYSHLSVAPNEYQDIDNKVCGPYQITCDELLNEKKNKIYKNKKPKI